MCVVVFVVVRGRAHWRAACSAAGCQGLNRAASELRFRGEIRTYKKIMSLKYPAIRPDKQAGWPDVYFFKNSDIRYSAIQLNQ